MLFHSVSVIASIVGLHPLGREWSGALGSYSEYV